MADFEYKQSQPYEFKVNYAKQKAEEFVEECNKRKLNCHVSVGGLDSITLLTFLRSIGIDVPAISCSFLEDPSIQEIHKQLGIIRLLPGKDKNGVPYTKEYVINHFGFPVISKEVANKISALQNPTDKNENFRTKIATGGGIVPKMV